LSDPFHQPDVGFAADGTRVEFSRDRFRADRTRLVTESAQIIE